MQGKSQMKSQNPWKQHELDFYTFKKLPLLSVDKSLLQRWIGFLLSYF